MKRKRPARQRVLLNRDAVWALLDQLGISQNELARRCGLSPGYMSLMMAGKRSPSPQHPAAADASPGSERFRRPVHLGNWRRSGLTHPHPHRRRGPETQNSPIHGPAGAALAFKLWLPLCLCGPTSRAHQLPLTVLLGSKRPLKEGQGRRLGLPVSGRGKGGWRCARGPAGPLAAFRRRSGPPRHRLRLVQAGSTFGHSPVRPPRGSPTPGPGCRTPAR